MLVHGGRGAQARPAKGHPAREVGPECFDLLRLSDEALATDTVAHEAKDRPQQVPLVIDDQVTVDLSRRDRVAVRQGLDDRRGPDDLEVQAPTEAEHDRRTLAHLRRSCRFCVPAQ